MGICQNDAPQLQFPVMINRSTVRDLLEPFEISISDVAIDKLIVYLNLLLRWNQKINLTAIRTPEECVTRHFGESFLLSRITPLYGVLLDIGSGGGFPGLGIKLIAPELDVVLLEPVAKKRAFLKEVSRVCDFDKVDVLATRLDEYSKTRKEPGFDIITIRAVGGVESLIPAARALMKSEGSLCLWLGKQQIGPIRKANPELAWFDPFPIPLSNERLILRGKRLGKELS